MGSTYGTWLRGDPRGWRARHHREHVEGDYKNPPPKGTYDELHEYSQRAMKRDAVFLDPPHRALACRAMAETLLHYEVELVELSAGAAHFHLIARFTPRGLLERPSLKIPGLPKGKALDSHELLKRTARHFVGIAKKNSARALTDAGLVAPGGVWAVRGKIKAIEDREHQLRVVKYIREHALEGAVVWSTLRRADEAEEREGS